ncbi:NADH-quinone oxidoreductase subunit G [Jatrophihabitans sp. YIM 134969]
MTAVANTPGAGAPPKPEDLVTVTIDGLEISVPKGTLLIRAAEMLGIQIPRFCDHPLLAPAGACRQCLVEVPDMGNGRGMPKPAASCTTTVMPGMVINTQLTSEVADKAQQGVMELLLINHPLDCPVCDKGGECPLQNQAMSNGRAESRFLETKRTFAKPIAVSENVLLDRERCVLCQRCTRFSSEIAGDPFIDLLERGANQQIGISSEQPFQSYFSGNTVQICPVGALTGASYRFRARPFDLMSTPSIDPHDSSGSAVRVDWRRGKVTRVLSGEDATVNEEWISDKTRWAFHGGEQTDRILAPQVRGDDGELHEASWPEALEAAAAGLRRAVDAGGVGVLPGGRITEEDAYAYAKFARTALGTNDVDMRARPGSDEELAFLAAQVAGVTPARGGVSFASLEVAPTVLVVGLEPEEEAPIVFLRLRKAIKRGTAVLGIAPYLSRGMAKLDAELLPCAPSAEADVLHGLSEATHTALRAPGAVILLGERLATSPGALTAAADLAESTGATLAWIPRRAGERGAVEAGALPNLLPGGGLVTDSTARAAVESLWEAPVPAEPGRDLAAMLSAAVDGSLGGLLIGGVEVGDLADPAFARVALAAVPFVVSLELRESEVTAAADVVLPVASVHEKSGRFVNWEGRERPFGFALPTGAMGDARVLDALADELDVFLDTGNEIAVRTELRALPEGTSPALPRTWATPAPLAPLPAATGGLPLRLATWHELLDAGRMQDGDANLAATAKPARAVISSGTAAQLGIADGDPVTIAGPAGAVTVPAVVDVIADTVVWVPTNARGCAVRDTLGAVNGSVVTVTGGAA